MTLTVLRTQLLYMSMVNKRFHNAPISGKSRLRILGVTAPVFAVVDIE